MMSVGKMSDSQLLRAQTGTGGILLPPQNTTLLK